MGGVPFLLAMATLGVDYGWQPSAAGGVEYIVQIPPDQLDQLQRLGGDISSTVDPSIRGRIHRVVIRVGEGELPRDPGPQPSSEELAAAPATPPDPPAHADQAASAGAAGADGAGADGDRTPIPIPSLEASDRLAMNEQRPGGDPEGSASVMRPAADEAAAGPGAGRQPTAAGAPGFAYPASDRSAAERDSGASGSSAEIPPFTGGSTEPTNSGRSAPTARDDRWGDASALRSGGPSTEPRSPPSTDPIARSEPRADSRTAPSSAADPRTAPSSASDPRDPRTNTTPWASVPASSAPAGSAAGGDGRSASPGPAAAQDRSGWGSGGFGAPPAGYADRSNSHAAGGTHNGYGTNGSGNPAGTAEYRGAMPSGQPTPQDSRGPYAPGGYDAPGGYAYQPDTYRGWETGNGGYRPAGTADRAPPAQQQPAYDGRSPAAYAAAPYYPVGQRSDAAQPPLGIPTPTAAMTQVASSGLPPAAAPTPAASPSDMGPVQTTGNRTATASDSPRDSLIDRSSGRQADEPRSLAFQPVFNGMLLLSLVANAYLLITLSRLLQRYRNIVSNVRTTAPHPSPTS